MGQGEPLLILHGFLGMSDNWRTHAKYWSSRYQVHGIDQRNHGKSFHADAFDYTLLAEDIVRYMDANKIEKTIVLGHSMGGKTAMTLALNYPERVSALIVADIAPKHYDVGGKFSNILKGLLYLEAQKLNSRSAADNAFSQFVSELGVRQFLLKNLTRTSVGSLQLKCNIQVLVTKLNEIGAAPFSGTYDGDTLFLAGRNSDYILDEDHEKIKLFFPKAKLRWVEHAGHWLHAENPEGFTAALHEFLD